MTALDVAWSCKQRLLPREQSRRADLHAIEINPSNAEDGYVVPDDVGAGADDAKMTDRLTIVRRHWAPGTTLTVGFLDHPPAELRYRILWHMNAWATRANVRFVESAVDPKVRIARADDGHWSYVGTDIDLIAARAPTMNLGNFTMATADREFLRVVRHEAGHTLGFVHEHMREEILGRLNRQKVIDAYMASEGWDEQEAIRQVLTPLRKSSVRGTPDAHDDSIMCYPIPAELTLDGKPIAGGDDIAESDYEFAASCYPFGGGA